MLGGEGDNRWVGMRDVGVEGFWEGGGVVGGGVI